MTLSNTQAAQPEQMTPAQKVDQGFMLTDVELARLFDVSLSTVRGWRFKGEGVPFVRLGRCIRYRAADVAAFVNGEAA